MKPTKTFASLLEAFFTDRLMKQRQASPNTIASYRDTFRLLLRYLQEHRNKRPSSIALSDLRASAITGFLNHLEKQRGNKPRSRNIRLAAIRSFFHYVAFEEPGYAELIQHVLAIPRKRWHRRLVSFLSPVETDTLIRMIDSKTKSGRRDYALLLLASQTGLRVSELIGLTNKDVTFGKGTHIYCHGKGRKERCVPVIKSTAKVLKDWMREQDGDPDDPIFTNAHGHTLSRDGVAYILKKYVKLAEQKCPSLRSKRVSPHVLRHTNAVNLLQAGVDQATIALWLGHESVETTQIYLHADMEYKEKVLRKFAGGKTKSVKYRPDDELLAFLNSL
jgi:site-specific recombinase XerD